MTRLSSFDDYLLKPAMFRRRLVYGEPSHWNATSENVLTALMLAAATGQTPNFELLLKYGADNTIADLDGRTARDYGKLLPILKEDHIRNVSNQRREIEHAT